jgi:drug/metabolite transporter (DMT)-like permease
MALSSRAALRPLLLTAASLAAFAANSLLCRLALKAAHIDAASFTSLRLVSGAAVLWLLVRAKGARPRGDVYSALALFVYAIAFSFAYVSLGVGVGALLAFGAVQLCMLAAGLWQGERPGPAQLAGLALSLGGLVYLVWPGLAAPEPIGAALMIVAGLAWGVYSLRGRGSADPVNSTAGNFLLAAPLAVLCNLPFLPRLHLDPAGVLYALVSGAVTSGLGYVLWYSALKDLTATRAAIVQLSAPVIAAFGGVWLLSESFTARLAVASCAILGGVALAILGKQRKVWG